MSTTTLHTQFQSFTPATAKAAFESVRAEIDAFDDADLWPINLDIPSAVMIAVTAAPRIEPWIPRMAGLPEFDVRHAVRMRNYALAAWYSHLMTVQPDDGSVATLLQEAIPLRRGLLIAAEALAHRGFLPPEHLLEIRGGNGHLDTANALVALSGLFLERWDELVDNTAVTADEAERAGTLGLELLLALGVRRRGVPGASEEALRTRDRAFSLFMYAYHQCRRAIRFLRWSDEDWEDIAPSLYVRRKRRAVVIEGEDITPSPPPMLLAPDPGSATPPVESLVVVTSETG